MTCPLKDSPVVRAALAFLHSSTASTSAVNSATAAATPRRAPRTRLAPPCRRSVRLVPHRYASPSQSSRPVSLLAASYSHHFATSATEASVPHLHFRLCHPAPPRQDQSLPPSALLLPSTLSSSGNRNRDAWYQLHIRYSPLRL